MKAEPYNDVVKDLVPFEFVARGTGRRAKRTYVGMFTDCHRIDRETLPAGKYAYDLRHDDDWGVPVTVEPWVVVNYYGVLVTDKEIPLVDGGPLGKFLEIKDWSYTD